MILPDKFCKAPFASAVIGTTGELATCCEYMTHRSSLPQYHIKDFAYWWSTGLAPMRANMINGTPDDGCAHCLSKESNPKEVHIRQNTNWRVRDSSQSLVHGHVSGRPLVPDLLEIRMGNLCNLNCIMCHSLLSSSIAAEVDRHRSTFAAIDVHAPAMPTPWWKDPEAWQQALDLAAGAKYLHLSGGEPFMHPRIGELLKAIDPQCQLSINTNLTLIDDSIIELLKGLPSCRLVWSVEGVGEQNHYVRWPTQWSQIQSTVDRLGDIEISPYHVLQHTSVFALPDLLHWMDIRGLPMNFGRVYEKSVDSSGMLTINSVSPRDHAAFLSWLDLYQGEHREVLVHWAASYQFDPNLHARYRRYVGTLDSVRGTDFTAVFAPNWVD